MSPCGLGARGLEPLTRAGEHHEFFLIRSCTSCAKEDEEPRRGGSQPSNDPESKRTTSLRPTKMEVVQERSGEKEHVLSYYNTVFPIRKNSKNDDAGHVKLDANSPTSHLEKTRSH